MDRVAQLIGEHRGRGRHLDVDGEAVFVADLAATGSEQGPPVVVVHGFPTSSIDWVPVLDRLRGGRRVVLFDLPGFGLSAKPDRRYDIARSADAAATVVAALGLEEVDLLTHDMGDTVGGELLARDLDGDLPWHVRRRVLTNGSIYLDMSQLTVGQQIMWAAPDELLPESSAPDADGVTAALTATLAPAGTAGSDPDPDHVRAAAELVVAERGGRLMPRLIRYLDDRAAREDRYTGAIERHPAPVAVVWGALDPVAVLAMAHQFLDRRPDAALTVLDGVGHYPMLEAPAALADAAIAHLDG